MQTHKMFKVIVAAGLAVVGPPLLVVAIGASCSGNTPGPPCGECIREGPPPPPDCDMFPSSAGCGSQQPDMALRDGSGDASPQG